MRNAPTLERFSRRSIGEVEPSRRGQLERDNKPSTRRELWAFMGLARRCAEGRKGSHREESSAARPLRTLAPVDAGTGGVWGRAVRAGPECSRRPAASGVPGDYRGAAVHNCSGFLSQPLPLPRRAASVRGCTRARHVIARGSPAVVHATAGGGLSRASRRPAEISCSCARPARDRFTGFPTPGGHDSARLGHRAAA